MFCEQINARPHRVTRRAPAEMLAEERARLHPVQQVPFTAALGVTRRADALVITHAGPSGRAEVARHQVTALGSPGVDDAHYPPAPPGALTARRRPRTSAEAQFLAIGDGAGLWLAEAAAAGASRVRAKMAAAVQLAVLHVAVTRPHEAPAPPDPILVCISRGGSVVAEAMRVATCSRSRL